jgi:hypothetical protein
MAFRGAREPVHANQPLSSWMAALDRPAEHAAAVEAVDAIGPAAIPVLLSHLRARNSSLGASLKALARRLGLAGPAPGPEYSPEGRRRQAVFVFERLGPHARVAIPELLRIGQDPDADNSVRAGAWQALAGVVGDDLSRYLAVKPLHAEPRVTSMPLTNSPGAEVSVSGPTAR